MQLLEKEIFETFSKSLLSSNNLETLAEQLADQLSRLDPRGWFQSITHSNWSRAVTLIIILVIIFVVYQCLSTKIVQTKQIQLGRAFFTKSIHSHPQLWKNKKGGIVRGRSTLRDPICFIPLCAISQGLSVPYQFLENRNKQSCTQFSGLRSWERAPAWILFSDSLQWLSSATL